ncbi:MAG: fkpA [Vampirovibrio sp.]|jgi:peptidylprolyl isomerase|nr:fkpA [Vampirovibrio sp.]
MKKPMWNAALCLCIAASSLLLLSACEPKAATTPDATTQAASGAAAKSVSGIKIQDVVEGTGKVAESGDTVSVNYLGTLASNGQKFDSSYDRNEPFTFRLGSGQVIEGWEKGIVGMKEGGKRILTIPPEKAYGEDGAPPVIPPNATLKFEVEMVKVE